MDRILSFSLSFVIFIIAAAACTSLPAQMVDDSGAPMALVPAGEFKIAGWEKERGATVVTATFVDDFYLDLYEVTNRRYAECVDAGVCVLPENTLSYSNSAYQDHPVVFVTWDMAQTYCQWRGARLPSKSEWDKGASDELEVVEYYWGDESPVCQVGARLGAGLDQNADLDPGTEPAGSHEPNIFGLYDMTGNVWEWVQDQHVSDQYKSSSSFVSFLRMSSWSGYGPVYRRFLCGFRCARSP